MFYFLNRHYIGGIWVDLRYSQKAVPFCELPSVPGFPRLLDYNQPFPIPLVMDSDILYRMETGLDRPITSLPRYGCATYRIDTRAIASSETVTLADCSL